MPLTQTRLHTRPDRAVLVYVDSEGTEHKQPVSDVVTVGTLIDPETGDDMEIVRVEAWT